MQEEEKKHKLSSDTILYILHQNTSQSDQSIKSENELTNMTQFTYLLPFYFVFHHLSDPFYYLSGGRHILITLEFESLRSHPWDSSHPLKRSPSKIKIKSNKSARGRREAQIIITHNIELLTPKYLTVWSKYKIWEWINIYHTIYLFTSILFCFPSFIFHFIIHKMEGTF